METLVTTEGIESVGSVTVCVVIEINYGIAISAHHKPHHAVEMLLPSHQGSAQEQVFFFPADNMY